MTLIDLGEVGFQQPADPPPPPPRWLRLLGIPSGRKASAAAALAILAGALAGTAPDPGPLPRMRTIPAVDIGNGAFWADGGVGAQYLPDKSIALATDLESGRELWSKRWADKVFQMNPGSDGTVLLQSAPAGTVPGSDGSAFGVRIIGGDTGFDPDAYTHGLAAAGTVTVLDLRTGDQRFSRPGALLSPWGAPDLVILERVPESPAGWRMTKVDIRDGHEVWSQPMPDGMRWAFISGDDFASATSGLLLMDSRDGSVVTIGTGGQATPRGQVKPGGNLEWAWSHYVGVSYPAGTGGPSGEPPPTRFEMHDLRTLTRQPLWTINVDPLYGSAPWLCGRKDRLCYSSNGQLIQVRIEDGTPLGTPEEDPAVFPPIGQSGLVGQWTVVTWDLSGPTIAALAPVLSKTGVGWLGLVRIRDGKPTVAPLMQTPLQITSCSWSDETWIICDGVQRDGTMWDRSLVLRKSEVEELARRLGAL